jgi:hypothetical protein
VNGNTLWTDAIAKEMKNVRVAFDMKEGDEKNSRMPRDPMPLDL